ncbi:hypothetical protein SSX86_027319 [Deinandra increscens subsp. villosa]|uniref:Uncharacterized protein n=1 Tax=Deinandra increscens subsp. villosa TaxID=3103831 RepID=A0AAP0CN33_9ASTR
MISGKKTANAVGGKTARACDSCVRKRARWYCVADDAFLCQSCDASVHSANQLAGRHERVDLLETPASSKLSGSGEPVALEPTWHQGFTRRARTPRQQRSKYSLKLEGKNGAVNSAARLVPEIGRVEASLLDDDEDEEELLYRVPVYDPFETELCNGSNGIDGSFMTFIGENKKEDACDLDDLQGFDLPSDDLELLDFAADVESLLGNGIDDTSGRIEDLGLTNNYKDEGNSNHRVKVEDIEVDQAILGLDLDGSKETLDYWDFDYETSMIFKEEEKKAVEGIEDEHIMMMVSNDQCNNEKVKTSSIILRLNYEDVINTWADQGCPWTNGTRPKLESDGSWPDFKGLQWSGNNNPSYGGGGVGGSDGGREARVSRYREKRRTRLFSKKIRYEVRKLNAEKRPRMKGRFVKRNL